MAKYACEEASSQEAARSMREKIEVRKRELSEKKARDEVYKFR